MSDYIKVKLGDLIEERNERCPDPQESGYDKFIGLEHMDTGRLEVKRYGSTDDVTTGCKICHKGDILFGRRNPYLRRAGVVNFDATCSGDIIVFRVSSDLVIPEYIPIVLASKEFWTAAMSDQGGTMSKRVHFEDFANYEFDLPVDINIQKKLSELVWSYERIICDCEAQLSNLDLLIKSRFIKMINQYETKYVALEDIVRKDRPVTYGIVKPGPDIKGGVPVVKVKHYADGILTSVDSHTSIELDSKYSRSKLLPGDILLSIGGTIGSVAIVPECLKGANITQHTARLSIIDEIDNKYIADSMRGEYFQKQVSKYTKGAAMKGLNLSDIKKMKVPIMPYDQQLAFSAYVDLVNNSKFKLQQFLDYLKAMQITIINGLKVNP